MTATVLLVRHANHGHLDKRLSGRMPGVPLTDHGREQAQALGLQLAGEVIDRVETSPLDRARETADAIAAAGGLAPPIVEESLVEIDMGRWTGMSFDDLTGDLDWRRWNEERATARIPGGETMAEAQARIVGRLERLATEPGDPTVVLVSHSDMIRGAVAWVLVLPLGQVLRFDVGPASITRVVVGDWGARLMSLNEKVW